MARRGVWRRLLVVFVEPDPLRPPPSPQQILVSEVPKMVRQGIDPRFSMAYREKKNRARAIKKNAIFLPPKRKKSPPLHTKFFFVKSAPGQYCHKAPYKANQHPPPCARWPGIPGS